MATTKRALRMTRGALYLLEGILQDLGPFTTPAKLTEASRLWSAVRAANVRTLFTPSDPDGYDAEDGLMRKENETDISWATRQRDHAKAFTAWAKEPVTIELSEKKIKLAADAAKWVVSHPKEAKIKLAQGENIASLFDAIGLSEDDEESTDE